MQLPTIPTHFNEIRVAENNDWVIFSILGCIFAYLFMLLSLNREAKLKEFILQEISDSSNALMNWIITSLVFCILFSVLISQYVPIVPKKISESMLFGYHLNKFGYTFITLVVFYSLKTLITFLFYETTENGEKWQKLYFISTKFYFVSSLFLIVANLVHYYLLIDKAFFLYFYFISVAIIFIFKILFYLFNKNNILPKQWFYKILYICTLQIIPILVLWKILFL